MKRLLLNLVTALSLLLCVAAAAVAVRSVLRHDSWRRYVLERPRWQYGEDEVVVGPGFLRYRWFRNEVFDESFARNYETQPALLAWRHSPWPTGAPAGRLEWLVPKYEDQSAAGSGRRGTITVPFLPPLLLAAALPALRLGSAVRRRRAARRVRRGLWPRCGYDVRATPGRCPECGAVPAEARGLQPPTAHDPVDVVAGAAGASHTVGAELRRRPS